MLRSKKVAIPKKVPMVRLNKYLANSGVASRRKCDDLIAAGKVVVNGKVEKLLGTRIDEKSASVEVEGIGVQPPERLQYVILNKPKGVVTTASDEKSRKTVLDLVDVDGRIFPVGRLDIDSTGLLILTNDGELSYKLTHPKFGVEKTYEVLLDSSLTASSAAQLEEGVDLAEGRTSKCRIAFPRSANRRLCRITLHQGWKRQVRRMFACTGYEVLKLKRVRVASVRLNGLTLGAWRHLSLKEVSFLKVVVG